MLIANPLCKLVNTKGIESQSLYFLKGFGQISCQMGSSPTCNVSSVENSGVHLFNLYSALLFSTVFIVLLWRHTVRVCSYYSLFTFVLEQDGVCPLIWDSSFFGRVSMLSMWLRWCTV